MLFGLGKIEAQFERFRVPLGNTEGEVAEIVSAMEEYTQVTKFSEFSILAIS